MMKISTLLFVASMFCSLLTSATEHFVQVSNFQFSPANLTVMVGDVITWQHVSGFHTTTSVTVPDGAQSWDSDISSSLTSFSYTVTVAGDYSYVCVLHNGMTASFIAEQPVSVARLNNDSKNALNAYYSGGIIRVNYAIVNSGKVSFTLYTIDGRVLSALKTSSMASGTYNDQFDAGNIPTGVYLLRMESGNVVLTERIFVSGN